jgi:hypothetical protein
MPPTAYRYRSSSAKAKSAAILLAVSLPSPALAIESTNTPAHIGQVQMELDQPSLVAALSSLASTFGFTLDVQVPLEGDERIKLLHTNDIKAILARILRNRNYVIRYAHNGKVESVTVLGSKLGSAARKDTEPSEGQGSAPNQTSGVFP